MKKVFLSSVAKGLEACRDAAYERVNKLDGYHCVRMEDFGARDAAPADLCRQKVRECDIFVGIVGPRYGSCPPDMDTSFTEIEYETARKEGRRRLVFVTDENFPLADSLREDDTTYAKLARFRSTVLADRGSVFFSSAQELALLVATAIHNSQPSEAGFRAYCKPTIVRREGHAELIGDVQITVYGAKRPAKVDISLTLDTYVTNRYDATRIDAIISSDRRGVLQGGQRPQTTNKVVFESVPLDLQHVDGDETITISGIRASVTSLRGSQQITAVLEMTSVDKERRELLRLPMVVALIAAETHFAVERAPDGSASFIGQPPAEAKVRAYFVEFFGGFPGAFMTLEQETAADCLPASHGTILRLQVFVTREGAGIDSKCRLFATTHNLSARSRDASACGLQAALVHTDICGAPSQHGEKPAQMLWNRSIPMVEVEYRQAHWEVLSPLGVDTILRFGFCVLGPAAEDAQLWAFAGLAPEYSNAAAHLPNGRLSIPRFGLVAFEPVDLLD